MRYDYQCSRCRKKFERECPVALRDRQFCDCNYFAVRVFQPADICIPSRFKVNIRSIMPTYEECAAIDKRNEEYLAEKKEPEKPSFEAILDKECQIRRVDPKQLSEYQLKDAVRTL